MRVGYSKRFKKQYKNLSKNVQTKFTERLVILIKNQQDERLHLHNLHGKLKRLKSINITGDIRAIFDEIESGQIEFVAIGSHSELYH